MCLNGNTDANEILKIELTHTHTQHMHTMMHMIQVCGHIIEEDGGQVHNLGIKISHSTV